MQQVTLMVLVHLIAIVDKHTGSIVDNYNNMTDEEKAKRKQMNESKLEQSNRQRNNDVQNNETKNNNETQHTSSNEENQNSAQSETQNDVQTSNQSENNHSTSTDASTQLKKNPQLLKWIVMNKHNQIIKVQIPKNKTKEQDIIFNMNMFCSFKVVYSRISTSSNCC